MATRTHLEHVHPASLQHNVFATHIYSLGSVPQIGSKPGQSKIMNAKKSAEVCVKVQNDQQN